MGGTLYRVTKSLIYYTGDVNGDGRADAVCAGDDGSVRVWEAGEDEAEIYTESWTDERFGFCVQERKQVKKLTHYKFQMVNSKFLLCL